MTPNRFDDNPRPIELPADPDACIDDASAQVLAQVLAQITSAQPRPGIEARIAATLALRSADLDHRATRRTPRWLTPWLLVPQAALLVAVGLLWMSLHRTASFVPQAALAHPSHPGTATARAEVHMLPTRGPIPSAVRETPLFHNVRLRSPHTERAERTLTAAVPPSFPAPPLPITRQEQLLRQLAHRNDPAQIAPLNPARRDAEEAREVAEFHAYFPQNLQEIPQ